VLTGNREFVRNNPVATKRVVRAILKATDLCAIEPGGDNSSAAVLLLDTTTPFRR
jgi:ABC-type nitrate/sulfonate/bicarbonate transport system substrate-binding protein